MVIPNPCNGNWTAYNVSPPRTPALVAVLAILIVTGCARKPVVRRLPRDLTAEQALAVVDARSSVILDLSASAAVTARTPEGDEHKARVSIRYRRPDRFRIVVRGFAGIAGVYISTTSDSVYAYYPSENVYLLAARSNDTLRRIAPELSLDLDRLTGIFSGTLPPAAGHDDLRLSLVRNGEQAVLTVETGSNGEQAVLTVETGSNGEQAVLTAETPNNGARYTLAGPDLLIVAEEIIVGGESVWRMEAEDFEIVDGVRVATHIKIWGLGGTMEMDLSRIEVNSGISDTDLALPVSATAGRIDY